MMTLFFINFIVFLCALLLTYKLLRIEGLTDSLIAVLLLAFSQIVFVGLMLGSLGMLFLPNVILLNLAVFFAIFLLTRQKKPAFGFSYQQRGALAGLLENRVILFALTVILAFGINKVLINLLNPPFGWDSLNYHFTFAVEWLKSGNLDNPMVINDDPFPTYYPINATLLFFWLILPLKNVFLADLGQLPFFIVSFLAVFSICRKLKINNEYSFFAASLFVLIPNFFKQLQIAYVDMMVAGIFLAALNFLLALREKFNLGNMVIFALSFALFIGLKTTALVYSIFILIPFLYLVFSIEGISFLKKSGYLGLLILAVLIFGSYSYIKCFILTGNPFYPLEVSVLGKPVFWGVIDKATFTARNELGGFALAKLLFHEGLGVQTLLVVLPGAILAFPVNIWKRKNKDLFLNYLLLLPLLFYAVFRLVFPIPNSRYLYPLLGIGMVVGFYAVKITNLPKPTVRIIAAICILASLFELAKRQELVISLISTILLVFFLPSLIRFFKRKRSLHKPLFCLLFLAAGFVILIFLEKIYLRQEYTGYSRMTRYSGFSPDLTGAWEWLEQNTTGNNIAYVGRPLPFPLYGRALKNNVYYVSVNFLDPVHLHDLKNSKYRWDNHAENMHRSFQEPNNYRGNADYAVWLRNLERRKTDILFIYSLHHTQDIRFSDEESWARHHPEKFNLIFSNDVVRIYLVKK